MPGGWRELLRVSFPLILSSGSISIQQFINRIFLSHWSTASVAAAMPAGALNWSLMSVFIGTAFYVSTFISQYTGSGQHAMVGKAMWQGIWVGVFGAFAMLIPYALAQQFFTFFGHPPEVIVEEVTYFRTLSLATFPLVACGALSCFFSGRGDTWTTLWVNLGTAILNCVLDYLMIFGHGPFHAMGILGAGYATLIANSIAMIVYLLLVFRKSIDKTYSTRSGWRIDIVLMKRLLYFGLPNGLHWFVDVAGFTIFNLMLGRLGMLALGATNIAFQVDMLGLIPMQGIGIGVSILVGQYIGANKPDNAERAGYSGMQIALVYILPLSIAYVFVPEIFLFLFRDAQGHNDAMLAIAAPLLGFAALVSLFDAVAIATSSAIKGAGDTHFVVWFAALTSPFLLILPTWLSLTIFHRGLYTVWTIAITYWCCLGVVFFLRFRQGKWKSMKVIEDTIINIKEPINLIS